MFDCLFFKEKYAFAETYLCALYRTLKVNVTNKVEGYNKTVKSIFILNI